MATHTPIPYWLSMSWLDVIAWSDTVGEVQREDREAAERGD
jgi:hypothetical protein